MSRQVWTASTTALFVSLSLSSSTTVRPRAWRLKSGPSPAAICTASRMHARLVTLQEAACHTVDARVNS